MMRVIWERRLIEEREQGNPLLRIALSAAKNFKDPVFVQEGSQLRVCERAEIEED